MTTRNYKSKFHFGDAELPYKYNSSVLRRSNAEIKRLRIALDREIRARDRAERWLEGEQRTVRSLDSVTDFMDRTKSKGERLRIIRREIDTYVDK